MTPSFQFTLKGETDDGAFIRVGVEAVVSSSHTLPLLLAPAHDLYLQSNGTFPDTQPAEEPDPDAL